MELASCNGWIKSPSKVKEAEPQEVSTADNRKEEDKHLTIAVAKPDLSGSVTPLPSRKDDILPGQVEEEREGEVSPRTVISLSPRLPLNTLSQHPSSPVVESVTSTPDTCIRNATPEQRSPLASLSSQSPMREDLKGIDSPDEVRLHVYYSTYS